MRLIRDINAECRAAGRPAISFEFFPPKTAEGERVLMEETLPALSRLRPDYCSVTYGAGGSTREKTLGIVDRIQKEHQLTAMMHLTCVNATRSELASVVGEARSRGICNILALRGDPPPGTEAWTATEGGFTYSRELVAYLHSLNAFSIGVAGFPEGHIAQAQGKLADWGYLREKVEAGADFIVTQLFFDNADFFEFHDHLRSHGIKCPIIPGIFPVLSANQTRKFVTMCGSRLPEAFLSRIDALAEDDHAVAEFGIEYAQKQCEELLRFGVTGIHFYTLNKVNSTQRIVTGLGLQGSTAALAAQ